MMLARDDSDETAQLLFFVNQLGLGLLFHNGGVPNFEALETDVTVLPASQPDAFGLQRHGDALVIKKSSAPLSVPVSLEESLQLLARAVDRAALPPAVAVHRLLAEFGGFEIVMMAGAMLGAAERGLILLIDGLIVSSALLAATRIAPAVRDYCIFCHRSAEPGHRAQLAALQAQPLIDLNLRLGEASGVALAWPLVRAAVAYLNEMASFETAGVSGKL